MPRRTAPLSSPPAGAPGQPAGKPEARRAPGDAALPLAGRPFAAAPVDALPADALPFAPSAQRPVRVRARRLAASTRIVPHRHAWAQLAFSATGVLRVTAERHTYIVPPSRAVWIPSQVEHVVTVVEDAELRTLYLHQGGGRNGPLAAAAGPTTTRRAAGTDAAGTAASDWQHCRVLEVSPLLRELVEQLAATAPPAPAREGLLAALVQDELARARGVALGVGLPADKRLRALCEAVLDNPARHATLQAWAAGTGASARTVARLFRSELGTSFAAWRQQVLLSKAVTLAARQRPMAHIAAELGYASASAFTAMVTRSVGVPPSRFFKNL
jgi:AraC-like DNA-binding protein